MRLRYAMGSILTMAMLQSGTWFFKSFMQDVEGEPFTFDVKASVLFNMVLIPFVCILLLELVRARFVTFKEAVVRVSGFVVILFVYFALRNFVGKAVADVYYYIAVIVISLYFSWFIFMTYRWGKRYSERLLDTYADLEGRSITWLRHILSMLAFLSAVFGLCYIILGEYYGSYVAHFYYFPVMIQVLATLAWNVDNMRLSDKVGYANGVIGENEDDESSIETDTVNEQEERYRFVRNLEDVCVKNRLYCQPGITREDVAKAINTNHIRLTRILKDVTGMTFSAYIADLRLKEAARMLKETDDSIEQIYSVCGYRTRSTFYRLFSDAYGCTPKEYREKALS